MRADTFHFIFYFSRMVPRGSCAWEDGRKGGVEGVSAGFVLRLPPQEVEDRGPLRQHLPAMPRHPSTPPLGS